MFAPYGESLRVTITNETQAIELPAFPASGTKMIRLMPVKGGMNVAYIVLGDGTAEASRQTGMPWWTGSALEIGIPDDETHMAVLVDAGTETEIVITSGILAGTVPETP